MRTPWVPVVLSSLVLAGWVAPAVAQDAMSASPAVAAVAPDAPQVAGATQLPAGAVEQPTVDRPGIVAGLTLGELYTDNIKLAPDGEPKQSRFVSVIQPFVKAAYKGNRLSGELNYMLSGYVYAGDSGANQVAQNLNTHGTLAIVQQHLFVDGAASYGRAIINNEEPAGSGTFFLGNNRANVATASVSPYWLQQLGRVGSMQVRYTVGRVVYNDNGIKGTTGNPLAGVSNADVYGFNVGIVSLKDQPWQYALTYVQQRIKSDRGQSIQFATAELKQSWALGVHTRVLVDVGKENRFSPNGTVDKLGANFWAVGIAWADPRNTFQLTGGHRFYGRSAELDWTHRASRLTTHVSYAEQPTDLNSQMMGGNSAIGLNIPTGVSGIPSLFDRRVYLMKRAMASAEYLVPNGSLSITLYNESRDFFLQGAGHETVSDAHLSWRMDVGPSTTLTPTFGWERRQFVDQRINYTRYFQLEAVHKFASGDFIRLRMRRETRNTHAIVAGTRGYGVNVIYLSWTHMFTGA